MDSNTLAILNSTFEIVVWPDIQEYMVIEGFRENAMLINEKPFINLVGSSAYFINSNWKKKADAKIAYNNGYADAQYNI